jgi:hypothetical protein
MVVEELLGLAPNKPSYNTHLLHFLKEKNCAGAARAPATEKFGDFGKMTFLLMSLI